MQKNIAQSRPLCRIAERSIDNCRCYINYVLCTLCLMIQLMNDTLLLQTNLRFCAPNLIKRWITEDRMEIPTHPKMATIQQPAELQIDSSLLIVRLSPAYFRYSIVNSNLFLREQVANRLLCLRRVPKICRHVKHVTRKIEQEQQKTCCGLGQWTRLQTIYEEKNKQNSLIHIVTIVTWQCYLLHSDKEVPLFY